MKNKIRFKDLSGWLKVAAVSAWITGVVWGIAFLIGFIEGMMMY